MRRLESELERQLREKQERLDQTEAENKLLRNILQGRAT